VIVEDGAVRATDPRGWRGLPFTAPARRPAGTGSDVICARAAAAGFNGRPVIEGLNLAVRGGEVVALMGPNGGGKTTLLRLLAGLLAPMSGTVERLPGRIAYLPQNPAALLHRPTVLDEVRFTIDRSGEHEEPATILAELSLLHVAGRYPRDLSSGERQRAAVAAVLPGTPRLVLLDEPTRGMDAGARDALVRLIDRLREQGSAIVIATHDAELRAAVADRVLMVAAGQVSAVADEALHR